MSAWGEMRRRSIGKLQRKEDKYEDKFRTLKVNKNRYDGSNNVIWKSYLGEDIVVDEDIANELDNFNWDLYKSNRKAFESSYIIDYFELL